MSEKITQKCCCCNETMKEKEVRVEYLYLDLNTCDRCVGTDAVFVR